MQKQSCAWLVCCQLVVIIPGLQPFEKFPNWPVEMAGALTGTSQKTASKSIVSFEDGKIDPSASPNLLLYDWSELSENLEDIADDTRVGGMLATTIIKKCSDLKKTSKRPIDVLIIAHSRGCYVACASARRLKGFWESGFMEMALLDPRTIPKIKDGGLESNPGGVVDWMTVYYQSLQPLKGEKIPGALNVDISSGLSVWPIEKGELTKHSQVHRWYLGTLLKRGEITKGDNIKFIQIYGGNNKYPDLGAANGPIIENFNGPISLVSSVFQGRRVGRTSASELIRVPPAGLHQIMAGVLQLTPAQTWVGGSALINSTIVGDFTAQFTLQMTGRQGIGSADGLAFVVLEPPVNPLGMLGGAYGFAGMGNGFAVAFDNYQNGEHRDPADVAQRVGIRIGSGNSWRSYFAQEKLPDSLTSDNRFRVRLTLKGSILRWHIYCHGNNKPFDAEMDLSRHGVYIPQVKVLGFSASTGDGAQRHVIDDVLIVPGTPE